MRDRSPEVTGHLARGVRPEASPSGVPCRRGFVRWEIELGEDENKTELLRASSLPSATSATSGSGSAATRSPGAIPRHLSAMRENIKRFILPLRRTAGV